jgi:cell wall assembly regulator SMI1
MISTLDGLWRRLEAWVRRNADAPLRLRPGAPEAELAAAERELGFDLPAELRASLRVHDGQDVEADDPEMFAWLPGCAPLARLEDIVAAWHAERARNEPSYAGHHPLVVSRGRLHHHLWHPRRIPIANAAVTGAERAWIDLFPGPEGHAGQVVTSIAGVELALLGPSLGEALLLHVEALESGEWAWSAGDRAIAPVEKRWAGGWLRYVEAKLYARPAPPSRPFAGVLPTAPGSQAGLSPPAPRVGVVAALPAPSPPGRFDRSRGEPGSG